MDSSPCGQLYRILLELLVSFRLTYRTSLYDQRFVSYGVFSFYLFTRHGQDSILQPRHPRSESEPRSQGGSYGSMPFTRLVIMEITLICSLVVWRLSWQPGEVMDLTFSLDEVKGLTLK